MNEEENKSETTVKWYFEDMPDQELREIFEAWLISVNYDPIMLKIHEELEQSVDEIVKYMKHGVIKIIDNELTIKFKGRKEIKVNNRLTGHDTLALNKINNSLEQGSQVIAKITGLGKKGVLDLLGYEMEAITKLIPFLG